MIVKRNKLFEKAFLDYLADVYLKNPLLFEDIVAFLNKGFDKIKQK